MTAEQWRTVKAVVHAALSRPRAERLAFVADACASDPVVRSEVESLLATPDTGDPEADDFLASPLRVAPDAVAARLAAALSDRYTIEGVLGRGGMATVFLAHDLRHRRRVAVKVLHPELSAALGAGRFLREIELTAALQHPHILPLFDSGQADGLLYFVMPRVEGETLREHLRLDRRLPVSAAVRLLRELADALAYAHEQGVVHRDIKPENVLLSRGHAMVADFGIAKALASAAHGTTDPAAGASSPTRLGVVAGTPAYMAPEQAAGGPGVDHRADLYALGVVAYELLVGETPFARLETSRRAEPPSLSERRPDVPGELAALVMRLLAEDPAARPQSAGEVIEALDGIVAPTVEPALVTGPPRISQPAGATPTGPANHVIPGRRTMGRAGAVVLGVTVVTAAAWYVATSARGAGAPARDARPSAAMDSAAARRVLVLPFENATGDSTLSPLGRMAAEAAAQGLAETGAVDVTTGSAGKAGGGDEDLRAAAAASGAGLIVSGAYYLDGDSVRLQARLTDVRHWRLVAPVPPVEAPRAAPQRLIDPLRRRLMAVVARDRDPTLREVYSAQPDYEAYREFAAGYEVFSRGDLEAALRFWARAAAMDTTFTSPVLISAQTLVMLGRTAGADSLLRRLARRREALPSPERGVLDRLQAAIAGDHAAALIAARSIRQAAPGWYLGYFLQAQEAVKANQPREALEATAHLASDSDVVHGRLGGAVYWRTVADAHHMLADYPGELVAGRAEREALPGASEGLVHEIRALAALGRIDAIKPWLDSLDAVPRGGATADPALLADLADELAAHGRVDDAREIRRRIATSTPGTEAARPSPNVREIRGRALSLLGRWQAADTTFAHLARAYPGEPSYLADRAENEARGGRRAEAVRIDQRLARFDRPYDRGRTLLARAEIAATLGDHEAALALLRRALAAGVPYGPALHADPAFAPLRSDARFRELLRPKG